MARLRAWTFVALSVLGLLECATLAATAPVFGAMDEAMLHQYDMCSVDHPDCGENAGCYLKSGEAIGWCIPGYKLSDRLESRCPGSCTKTTNNCHPYGGCDCVPVGDGLVGCRSDQ